MRRLGVLLAALGAVAVVPAIGTATLARDALVRPGAGIGKVEYGMTLEQVKRALGAPPRTVIRRLDLGARGRYIERGWEIEGPLSPYTWTVGFRSTTRTGVMRVVRVSTSVPTQRTREGLGVGSRPRDIVRRFPNAACELRDRIEGWYGSWVVVRHQGRGMTAFLLTEHGTVEPPVFRVGEVLVQPSWVSDNDPPGLVEECYPNWRNS